MLKASKNLNTLDTNESTPLHRAPSIGHIKVVELLRKKEAYVNEKNKDGDTQLHLSASIGHTRVVELLSSLAAQKVRGNYLRGKNKCRIILYSLFYITSSVLFIMLLVKMNNVNKITFFDKIINSELMNAIQNNKALFGIILSTLIYLACLHLLKSLSCIAQKVRFCNDITTFLMSKTNINETERQNIKHFHPLNGIAICAIWDNLSSKLIKNDNVSIVGGNIIGGIGYLINRAILGALATFIILDLIQTFQGKTNLLGLNVLPEFITQSQGALIGVSAIVGIMAIFFIVNTIIDMLNLIKIKTKLFEPKVNTNVNETQNAKPINEEQETIKLTKHLDDKLFVFLDKLPIKFIEYCSSNKNTQTNIVS